MVDVFLETDLNLIHRVANSADVREFIRPDGAEMDWAVLVEQSPAVTQALMLSNRADAVAAFERTAPRVYQVHTMFAGTCRGRRAIDTGRAMLRWMFEHGAEIVWGSTPRSNLKACWFNRHLGTRELPTSDAIDFIFEVRRTEWAA